MFLPIVKPVICKAQVLQCRQVHWLQFHKKIHFNMSFARLAIGMFLYWHYYFRCDKGQTTYFQTPPVNHRLSAPNKLSLLPEHKRAVLAVPLNAKQAPTFFFLHKAC